MSGNLKNEYVFFGGKRIARRDSSGNIFYYFADHLGTSREIVQAGQSSPCYDADFFPFGGERTPIVNSCSTSQNYKFTGKERDAESGLDNFGARYYTSNIGRFMSPDWAAKPTSVPYAQFGDPQSLNLYSYVGNNPETRMDADGHCPICLVVIGVAAVAVVAYSYHHFFHNANNVLSEAKATAHANQDVIDAATRGDETDAKSDEYDQKQKQTVNDAKELVKEGMQLPGTSIGGDIPTTIPDAAATIITTVAGKAMDNAAKQTTAPPQQQQAQQQQAQQQQAQQQQQAPTSEGSEREKQETGRFKLRRQWKKP